MRAVAYILLVIVLSVVGIAIGAYLYLKPEQEPPRLPSPSSVRTVENGTVIGRQGRHKTHAWLGIPYAAPPTFEARWKATAVDELASLMRQAQGESVYAYRFDADDWRNLGFIDLQKLLGAAHGMEIPFVFGNGWLYGVDSGKRGMIDWNWRSN